MRQDLQVLSVWPQFQSEIPAMAQNTLGSLCVIAVGSSRVELDRLLALQEPRVRKWMRDTVFMDDFNLSERCEGCKESTSEWHIFSCGHNRLVYADKNLSRVMKIEVRAKKKAISDCANEWKKFCAEELCREDVPTCYGFTQISFGHLQCDVLVCQRIAFNLQVSLDAMFSEPPDISSLTFISIMTQLTLEAMRRWTVIHCMKLDDWHTGNINFTDSDPLKFVLIDFDKNQHSPESTERTRMEKGFSSFVFYLEHNATGAWKPLMRDVKKKLLDCWRNSAPGIPSSSALDALIIEVDRWVKCFWKQNSWFYLVF
jgi:hypothetical protein